MKLNVDFYLDVIYGKRIVIYKETNGIMSLSKFL